MLSADLAPQITLIEADNRGLIALEASSEIFENTVNSNSVEVSTAGDDLLFGTDDDVFHTVEVQSVSDDARRFELLADGVPADARYSVRLDSSLIRGPEGFLDGEFNGLDENTGDGAEGGDLVFFTSPAASPIARISTIFGAIDVQLFADQTPISVANFLNVANLGRYDSTIFHRSVPDFIIQGGGFEAEPPFESIERVDPIQNEPGILNTRGTLAYAKLGGQPNSATTEFFFNVQDNPNLDTQNGGFTVFGEITSDAGLAIMDMINALETFDASSIRSALGELPVLDPGAIASPGDADMEDVIIVERVAALMDIAAMPPGQPAGESVTIQGDGAAFLTIFDIAGAGLTQIDEMMTVRFADRGDRVSRVILEPGFPEGAGIAIGGAESVGDIRDKRRDSGDLAFIVSNAGINNIRINGAIAGADLNGAIVAGMQLATDIDNDGSNQDLTAVFTDGGSVRSIRADSLVGDIVIDGGLKDLRVNSDIRDLDIVLGGGGDATRFRFAGLTDVSIRSESPINKLIAEQWLDRDETPDRLAASSMRVLKTQGDFEADLMLSEAEQFTPILRVARIGGDLRNARLDAAGDVRNVVVRGDLHNVSAVIDGELKKFRAGSLQNVDLMITGAVNRIIVDEWFGGELVADTLKTLVTRGGDTNGDLAADITLNNNVQDAIAANKIRVRGDVFLSDVQVLEGAVRTIKIQGDLIDSSFDIRRAIQTFKAGDVRNSEIDAGVELVRLIVGEWEGGALTAGIGQKIVRIDGDARNLDLTIGQANRVDVRGDIDASLFRFNGQLQSAEQTNIRRLNVNGEIIGSDIVARFFITNLNAEGLRFSSVVAGAMGGFEGGGFPDNPPASIDNFGTIVNMRIDPPGRDEGPNVVDSFVVAAGLLDVQLGEIEPENFGATFGVAAAFIDRLDFFMNGQREFFSTEPWFGIEVENPTPIGDFEIREGFVSPGEEPIV